MSQNPWRSEELTELQNARKGSSGKALGQYGLSQLQYRMGTKKYKLFDIEFQLWQVLLPVIGYFTGTIIGKLLRILSVGLIDLTGLLSLAGLIGALVLWWKSYDILGYNRTLAVAMAVIEVSRALDAFISRRNDPNNDMFLGAALGLGFVLVFPYLQGLVADKARMDADGARTATSLGVMIAYLVMMQGWLLKWVTGFDPYLLLGGWLGSGGGLVMASLVGTSLWYWGGE